MKCLLINDRGVRVSGFIKRISGWGNELATRSPWAAKQERSRDS